MTDHLGRTVLIAKALVLSWKEIQYLKMIALVDKYRITKMENQPTHYTCREGGNWLEIPLGVEITKPMLLAHRTETPLRITFSTNIL